MLQSYSLYSKGLKYSVVYGTIYYDRILFQKENNHWVNSEHSTVAQQFVLVSIYSEQL